MCPDMQEGRVIGGRYMLKDLVATGGMGRVYLGQALGAAGFSRSVAIKCLLPDLSGDPEFIAMLLDEATLTSRIHHQNVVATLDVVMETGEVFLVMEYVPGVSLHVLSARARARGAVASPEIVAALFSGILRGLHAAHEATGTDGQPLGLVHRDVSPQNVLVTEDGSVKVADFGIAKAQERLARTRARGVKGKPAYMAPEQLRGGAVDRRADVYAIGVMLWETIVGARLFPSERADDGCAPPAPILSLCQSASALCFAKIVERALEPDVARRFASAGEMAEAIEAEAELASPGILGAWALDLAGELLEKQRSLVSRASAATGDGRGKPAEPTRIESAPKRPRRRGSVVLAAVAACSSLAFGWAAFRKPPAATADLAPSARTGPAADAGSPTSLVSVSAPSSETVVDAATPPAAPSSRPATADLPVVRKPASRPMPATSRCSPPFTIDERGTKIPKRECL